MAESSPKISIIIPVYNVEKYLAMCIDSILLQTYTNFECILVNDCSLDKSGKICDEYAKKDKRISVIHNTENRGSSISRKIGVDASLGEYIQFIDSDDWIDTNMIELLYQKAISENLDITVCGVFREHNNCTTIINQEFSFTDKISIIKNIIYKNPKSFLFTCFLVNKLIKKDLFFLIDFPEYCCSEDSVIIIQSIYHSNKIGYVTIPLYHYRYNPQSLSNNKTRYITKRIEQNKNWSNIIDFLKKKYDDLQIFEPELSKRVNKMKKLYLADKDLRKNKELFRIYPESKFKTWLFFYCIKKLRNMVPKISQKPQAKKT